MLRIARSGSHLRRVEAICSACALREVYSVDLDGYAITIYDRDAPPGGWDQTD